MKHSAVNYSSMFCGYIIETKIEMGILGPVEINVLMRTRLNFDSKY